MYKVLSRGGGIGRRTGLKILRGNTRTGSSPVLGTMLCLQQSAPLAQLDRAFDYESKGREFESLRARHKNLSCRRGGMADAFDSKSNGETRGGSSPLAGTKLATNGSLDYHSNGFFLFWG